MGNLYMLCPDNLYQVIKASAYANANKPEFKKINESTAKTATEKEKETKAELDRIIKLDEIQIHRAGRLYFSMWFIFTCTNKNLALEHMSTETYDYLVAKSYIGEEKKDESSIIDFFTPKVVSNFMGTVGTNNYQYDEAKINRIQRQFLNNQLEKIKDDKEKPETKHKNTGVAQTLNPKTVGFRVVPSPLISKWWLVLAHGKALSDLPAQNLDKPAQQSLYKNYLNPRVIKPTFIKPVLL